MRELVIATGEGEKGRSFSALLLGYVLFGSTSYGSNDTLRPVWMSIACSPAEVAPFVANLRTGKRAELVADRRSLKTRFELLRSAGYEFAQQRHPQGTIVTAYLPSLFRIDPGMVDPDGVRFVVLPGREWAAEQRIDATAAVEHVQRVRFDLAEAGPGAAELAALAPTAALFAAYLDRRTRCPLVPGLPFYLQVLVAALSEGLASLSCARGGSYSDKPWGQHSDVWFKEDGTDVAGLLPGVGFDASHEELEAFLAEQVAAYFKVAKPAAREAA